MTINKYFFFVIKEGTYKFPNFQLENMNIHPPVEKRFSPFEFYSFMRKNNPVAFDEQNEMGIISLQGY